MACSSSRRCSASSIGRVWHGTERDDRRSARPPRHRRLLQRPRRRRVGHRRRALDAHRRPVPRRRSGAHHAGGPSGHRGAGPEGRRRPAPAEPVRSRPGLRRSCDHVPHPARRPGHQHSTTLPASRSPHDLAGLYDDMADRGREPLVSAIETIAGFIGDGPVMVHCAAGKDRTGMVVALVQAAIGVDAGRHRRRVRPVGRALAAPAAGDGGATDPGRSARRPVAGVPVDRAGRGDGAVRAAGGRGPRLVDGLARGARRQPGRGGSAARRAR